MAGSHRNAEISSKDELIKQLQDQVTLWRNKYEALAKLYSQLRTEHLDMLAKFKQHQLKANSAQEAIDKMERMERDLKAKNLELADMLRERDRARFEVDRSKSFHGEEVDRLRRELDFANERAEDSSRNKNSEVSHILSKYNRQISELEDSLKVCDIMLYKRASCSSSSRTSKITWMSCLQGWTMPAATLNVSGMRRTKKLPLWRKAWMAPFNNFRMKN